MMLQTFFVILASALTCYVAAETNPKGSEASLNFTHLDLGSDTVTLSLKLRKSLSPSGENSPEDVEKLNDRALQFGLSLEPFVAPPPLSESSANSTACAVDPVEEYKQQILFGLGRFYQTTVPLNELKDVLFTFRNMTEVESAQVAPEIALWEVETVNTEFTAVARVTPDYSGLQSYLYAPTPAGKYKVGGVNAKQLHDRYPQVKGRNARIVSVENSHWLYSHEDLPEPWITHWTPQTMGSHDTMSAGVMFAKDNGFGVIGIATGAAAGYSRFDRTGQLPDLAKHLKAGDVLQLGVQASVDIPGTNDNDLVPIEYHEAVRTAIQYLVEKKGVHVIYAAGNGGLNADKYVPRSKDSGAISVGALHASTGARSPHSNWGERVDLFSWGNQVTTTHADAQRPDINNLYTNTFSGTSSANPIVAGGVALLQSIAFELDMGPIPPKLMREALVKTGVSLPKVDPGQHQVQPDLVKALEYLIRKVPAKEVDL